jgi:hypothetical protein|tara:strand:+ start:7450 stop:7662 length:213 start_codon:yes stop_codon:yes gene_type:complete
MKLERINEKDTLYVLCEECNELIGPSTPAVEVSHGFIAEDGFYIDESVVLHTECVKSNTLTRVVEKIEKN